MALLNAFRDAMARLGVTGKLIVSEITETSPAFQRADLGVLVPRVSDANYLPALLKIAGEQNVGLLIPLTDPEIPLLSQHAEKFSDLGCTVMTGSPESIAVCRHKDQTNRRVHESGLASIETFSLEAFRANPFYPCFVKPISGSASIGSSVIPDEAAMKVHIARFGENLIVQECIVGPEYTVDVYRSRDGKIRCVVPRQRLLVRSGEVEKGITVYDERIISDTIRLVEHLDGLWGVFCCQCRRDAEGVLRFFEINPRFGGGAPLSIAAGADLPLYLLQEVLGLEITAELGRFTDRLLMMRYDEAVFKTVDDPSLLPGFKQPDIR